MPGHLLSVFEPAIVLQTNCDAGSPPSVTSHRGKKTRILGPLANRCPTIVAVYNSSRHGRSKRVHTLE